MSDKHPTHIQGFVFIHGYHPEVRMDVPGAPIMVFPGQGSIDDYLASLSASKRMAGRVVPCMLTIKAEYGPDAPVTTSKTVDPMAAQALAASFQQSLVGYPGFEKAEVEGNYVVVSCSTPEAKDRLSGMYRDSQYFNGRDVAIKYVIVLPSPCKVPPSGQPS
jgi:hypothetical protein